MCKRLEDAEVIACNFRNRKERTDGGWLEERYAAREERKGIQLAFLRVVVVQLFCYLSNYLIPENRQTYTYIQYL